MFHPIDDLRIKWTKVVLPPIFLEEEMPTTETASATVHQARHEICEILGGTDRRLRAVFDSRPRGCAGVRQPAQKRYRRVLQGTAHRDARLFRETPHHGRMEGLDQRSSPRPVLPDQ